MSYLVFGRELSTYSLVLGGPGPSRRNLAIGGQKRTLIRGPPVARNFYGLPKPPGARRNPPPLRKADHRFRWKIGYLAPKQSRGNPIVSHLDVITRIGGVGNMPFISATMDLKEGRVARMR